MYTTVEKTLEEMLAENTTSTQLKHAKLGGEHVSIVSLGVSVDKDLDDETRKIIYDYFDSVSLGRPSDKPSATLLGLLTMKELGAEITLGLVIGATHEELEKSYEFVAKTAVDGAYELLSQEISGLIDQGLEAFIVHSVMGRPVEVQVEVIFKGEGEDAELFKAEMERLSTEHDVFDSIQKSHMDVTISLSNHKDDVTRYLYNLSVVIGGQ